MSDQPGYVYVVQNPSWPGWVKVGLVLWKGRIDPAGRSQQEINDRVLSSRISNLNISDPHKAFEGVFVDYAASVQTAERFAHTLLEVNFHRGDGEWFRCPTEVACQIVGKTCAVARLRPEDRLPRWEALLVEEQGRTNADTQEILREIIESARLNKPSVAETVQAALQIIETLLDELEKANDYATTAHSQNLESAARAVMRRLRQLSNPESE